MLYVNYHAFILISYIIWYSFVLALYKVGHHRYDYSLVSKLQISLPRRFILYLLPKKRVRGTSLFYNQVVFGGLPYILEQGVSPSCTQPHPVLIDLKTIFRKPRVGE